jgi:hypothetical protein
VVRLSAADLISAAGSLLRVVLALPLHCEGGGSLSDGGHVAYDGQRWGHPGPRQDLRSSEG